MKNVIGISSNGKSYVCNSLTNTNDGTNCVVFKIVGDHKLHPVLTIDNEKVAITEKDFSYELPRLMLYGNGDISFNISDDQGEGEKYTISKAVQADGNLFLKKISDNDYKLSVAKANDKDNIYIPNYTNSKNPYRGEFDIDTANYKVIGIIPVTDELESGTWLMNFRLTFRKGIPACGYSIIVGDYPFTYNQYVYRRLKSELEETVAFSAIVTSDVKFIQKLTINIVTDYTGDVSGHGEILVIVDAVKLN